MRRRWSLIALAGALMGMVSCSPMAGTFPGPNGSATPGARVSAPQGERVLTGSAGSSSRVTSGELRQIREQRERMGSEHLINAGNVGSQAGFSPSSSSGEESGQEPFDEANLPPLPPLSIDYRYAMPVPGRNGWVYNPYTNRPVDVRGVESGRLIYDERDPENRNEDGTLKSVANMPNKFRVP